MAIRVVLFLTLFTGLCVADHKRCYTGCNLALGAKADQSSTYVHISDAVAQRAVDGNRNSVLSVGSCTHTNAEMNPWWRVDLGRAYMVNRVSITNRGDCCGERINGAEIHIGNSLDNSDNSYKRAATVDTMKYGETKTFEFNPIKGRYVKIVIPGYKMLTLCEVEVFADSLD